MAKISSTHLFGPAWRRLTILGLAALGACAAHPAVALAPDDAAHRSPEAPDAGPEPTEPGAPPLLGLDDPADPGAEVDVDRRPDVIFVPTPQPVVDKMLELAKVTKADVVYDLGCGDGRIVVTAAQRYGARGFGFDIDPERVNESLARVSEAKVESLVTIKRADIFTLDLSRATVVTMYLLPSLNLKLVPQLTKLAPGSRIVTHDFPIRGFRPVEHFVWQPDDPDESEHEIFLYVAPLEPSD